MTTFLLTGIAGFIGSNFLLKLLDEFPEVNIIGIDKLTYASNIHTLGPVMNNPKFTFIKADINNTDVLNTIFQNNQINCVVHFAAESHVDNSIEAPSVFIETNIMGTFNLLKTTHSYYKNFDKKNQQLFRFIHISTDEVYGTLNLDAPDKFNEESPYRPNSPYSASKASSDLIARSYYKTYAFPVIITNCSNNFGPRQNDEKLIPKTILSCLMKNAIPVYGDGKNVRDWIHVEDHSRALISIINKGKIGESYCIGGQEELSNIDVVNKICVLLDKKVPLKGGQKYNKLITFIKDRPGHDRRYAINDAKIKSLGYENIYDFNSGLSQTVEWYLKLWQKRFDLKLED